MRKAKKSKIITILSIEISAMRVYNIVMIKIVQCQSR